MLTAHFAFVISQGRLGGLLTGEYEEAWVGETFAMLGRVWGAGACPV